MRSTVSIPGPAGLWRFGALLIVLLALAIAFSPSPGVAKEPRLDATSWLLIDRRDGEVLASRKPESRRAIASTTKLMTAYLAIDQLSFGERIRMPAYDANPAESLAGLRKGEKLTVKDLLYALLLASANDAAEALATGTSGSVKRFVKEMNQAAADLGLKSTSFANPIGLDQKQNFSTASDLAELSQALLSSKKFRTIVDTPEYVMRSGDHAREITNTNTLLLEDPSVDGVKTGHTSDAGYVLIASAKRGGVSLLSLVLGAPSESARNTESAELLDYGFSRYQRLQPVRRAEAITEAKVRYEDEPLPVVAARGVKARARGDQKVDVEVDAPREVEGPIEAGERLGSVTVRVDGRVVGRSPLRAGRTVAAPGIVDRIGGPVVALIAILALVVILLLTARWVRGRGSRGGDSRSSEERAMSRQQRARKRNGN